MTLVFFAAARRVAGAFVTPPARETSRPLTALPWVRGFAAGTGFIGRVGFRAVLAAPARRFLAADFGTAFVRVGGLARVVFLIVAADLAMDAAARFAPEVFDVAIFFVRVAAVVVLVPVALGLEVLFPAARVSPGFTRPGFAAAGFARATLTRPFAPVLDVRAVPWAFPCLFAWAFAAVRRVGLLREVEAIGSTLGVVATRGIAFEARGRCGFARKLLWIPESRMAFQPTAVKGIIGKLSLMFG